MFRIQPGDASDRDYLTGLRWYTRNERDALGYDPSSGQRIGELNVNVTIVLFYYVDNGSRYSGVGYASGARWPTYPTE